MAFIKITIVLLLGSFGAPAQTFTELFSQGKTQKKHLCRSVYGL